VAIERGRESGLSTAVAENLLNTMLVSLSLMNRHKARIEAELKALKDATSVQLWQKPLCTSLHVELSPATWPGKRAPDRDS